MFDRDFNALPPQTRNLLLAGGIAAVVAVGLLLWWALTPRYAVLFDDLAEADQAEIVAALKEWKVPYRFDAAGSALLVPEDQVHDARLRLVGEGVPAHGTVGFELFKDSDYGMTEFAQKVNFQRALQGELERTIAALDAVRSVRVHLTLRRQGLFLRDQDPPKASVTITPERDATLSSRQIAGIQRLVAAAVEGLAPEAVVVLDQHGASLSSNDPAGDLGERRAEQQRIERELERKVGQLLSAALGLEDFSVSVDVRLNFDRVRQVRERLEPQGPDGQGLLLRRRDTHSQTPSANSARPEATRAASGGTEVEYAHSKATEDVAYATGRVERISVGVVVPVALPAAQQARLRELIAAAVGLDPQRGDRIELAAFAPEGVVADAAPAEAGPAPQVAAPRPAPALDPLALLAALLGAVALAAFAGFALARRGAAPRLAPAERDRLLEQMRAWLAEPAAPESPR